MKRYFILLFLISFKIHSQELDNRIYSYNIESIKYFKYENINVYADLKNVNEVTNDTPEELLQSIFSCSNKNWDIKNTLGGESKIENKSNEEYQQVTKIDKKKNFIQLVNKLEYNIIDVPTCILKFYFISESFPKPQAGFIVCQKINSKWFKTDTKMVNNLALSLLRLKPELFDKLINKDFKLPELFLIKSKVLTDNKIDFNKLSSLIDSWYEKDKKTLEIFKDPNSIL